MAHHKGRQRNQDILSELVSLDQELEKILAYRETADGETHEQPQEVGETDNIFDTPKDGSMRDALNKNKKL